MNTNGTNPYKVQNQTKLNNGLPRDICIGGWQFLELLRKVNS
jgi:hypothetical protein